MKLLMLAYKFPDLIVPGGSTRVEKLVKYLPRHGVEPHVLSVQVPRTALDDVHRDAVRTRSFWILAVALLVFFLYFLAVLEHFVAALEDAGTPKARATTWFSIAIGMGLVSKVGMGVFADRVSPRRAFFVNHALLALSAWLLLVLPAPGVLPLFVALFGFSYAARALSSRALASAGRPGAFRSHGRRRGLRWRCCERESAVVR